MTMQSPAVFEAMALVAFRRLAHETAGLRDPALVAQRALRIVVDVSGAVAGEIHMMDQAGNGILRQQCLIAPPEMEEAFRQRTVFELGEDYPGIAIQERSPILSYNLRTDPRFLRRAVVDVGFKRGIVVPLMVQNHAVGTLGIFYHSVAEDNGAMPLDLDFLIGLAAQIAATIDAASLYQHLDRLGASTAPDTTSALQILAARHGDAEFQNRLSAVRAITHEVARLRESELKRQRQLYETELESRKLRTLIDSMPEGFMYADKAGSIVEINEIGRAILGIGPDALGRSVIDSNSEVYDSDGVRIETSESPIAWALTRGVLTRAREMVMPRDGQSVTLLVSAVPVRSADGQVEGAVSVFQDISQLKEIQRGLERAWQEAETGRSTLRSIIDNIPDGFIYIEADGRVVEINRVARDMLGVGDASVETLESLSNHYSMHQATGAQIAQGDAPLTLALRGDTILSREFVVRRTNETEVNVISSTAPILDAAGAVAGAVSILQDVTSLKEAERIKSRFLSMVTHELRTPLAAIKGLVSGLLEEDVEWDTETERSFLQSIEGEVDSLTALISNILDMARLEAGYMRPSLEECSIYDIVNDMSRKLQPLAVRNEQRIEISNVSRELPMMIADYNQIERVLVNLVANAIKYAPDGTAVEVNSSYDANTDQIEVLVADRGPGIPSPEQQRIFDAFFRGQQMAGRAGRMVGTGLGLAICHDIVVLHGGRIWYEDREGGGSMFRVRLPRYAIVG